ncbi:MAG: hypothetical protein PVF33_01585 [Candidatus Latescibacterota bacterium]|jgi:hypothetical protein
MKVILFTALALVVLTAGCSTDDEITAATLDDAWAEFQAGRYQDALGLFNGLVATSGEAAHEGKGWCNLKLDRLDDADVSFANSANRVDANAGWVIVKWALEEYDAVHERAVFVLNRDGSYVFKHDKSVDYRDLILHDAYSYFHLGNYENCLEDILLLDAAFQADLNDPGIEETLLQELESLKDDID